MAKVIGNYRNTFQLAKFRGDGYDKGAGTVKQIFWVTVSSSIFKRWWLPNRFRIQILRAFGASIGAGVLIRHGVKIHWPWKLAISDNCWIGEEAWILNLENVIIGKNTCISQGALLCTGSHDRRSPSFEFDNAPIVLGEHVWLAARTTILRGVTVGDGATVGAAVVVTRDVPPGTTLIAT